MNIICTYCSAAKREDGGLLPAIRRYKSDRIVELSRKAGATGAEFMILSGEFGLIEAEHPIPFYDHLLSSEEVDELSSRVAATLRQFQVTRVEYHTAAPELVAPVRPYLAVMEAGCDRASVVLRVVILTGDPA